MDNNKDKDKDKDKDKEDKPQKTYLISAIAAKDMLAGFFCPKNFGLSRN